MILPKEAVEEYQAIYKKVFGKDITYAEAEKQGSRLLRPFEAIYLPLLKKPKSTTDSV